MVSCSGPPSLAVRLVLHVLLVGFVFLLTFVSNIFSVIVWGFSHLFAVFYVLFMLLVIDTTFIYLLHNKLAEKNVVQYFIGAILLGFLTPYSLATLAIQSGWASVAAVLSCGSLLSLAYSMLLVRHLPDDKSISIEPQVI
ncbi:MAG: hypothetical protein JW834_03035 [Candidatus Diapherotrites archaeon]|nr:hypothetical protein [Candidatus Diapherotrites archaeon]